MAKRGNKGIVFLIFCAGTFRYVATEIAIAVADLLAISPNGSSSISFVYSLSSTGSPLRNDQPLFLNPGPKNIFLA